MRILIVHPLLGPDFSVADVFTGWYEALRDLLGRGNVAPFALNDRLVAHANALVDTHQVDETGHPIVKNMFTEEGVYYAAMEGLSHALLTFWRVVHQRFLPQRRHHAVAADEELQDRHAAHRIALFTRTMNS